MATTYFYVSPTSGTGSTDVLVGSAYMTVGDITTNKTGKAVVSNGAISKTVSVITHPCPLLYWTAIGKSDDPTSDGYVYSGISATGGTIYMTAICQYPFKLGHTGSTGSYYVDNSVSADYGTTTYAAGTHTIKCIIPENNTTSEATGGLWLNFTCYDGVTSDKYTHNYYYKWWTATWTQEAGTATERSISLSPEPLSVSADGGTYTITITFTGRTSGETLLVGLGRDDDDYVTVTQPTWSSSTSTTGTFTVTVSENTTTSERTSQYVEVYTRQGTVIQTNLHIKQEAATPVTYDMTITKVVSSDGTTWLYPTSLEIPNNSQAYKLTVDTNDAIMDIGVSDSSWMHTESTDGSTYATFYVDANSTTSTRSGSFILYGNQITSVELPVTQEASSSVEYLNINRVYEGETEFILEDNTVYFSPIGSNDIYIELHSNAPSTAYITTTSSSDMIEIGDISKTSTNYYAVNITVADNISEQDVTGSITFTYDSVTTVLNFVISAYMYIKPTGIDLYNGMGISGDSFEVVVYDSMSGWSAEVQSDCDGWVSIDSTTDEKVYYSVAQNTTGELRTGTIYIYEDLMGAEAVYTITQYPEATDLYTYKLYNGNTGLEMFSIPASGGTHYTILYYQDGSEVSYTQILSSTNCTPLGAGGASVMFKVDENTSSSTRTISIKVEVDNTTTQTLYFTQEGA